MSKKNEKGIYIPKKMKENLDTINFIFARVTEWLCLIDTSVYESRDKIISFLNNTDKVSYIRYAKDFRHEILEVTNKPFKMEFYLYIDKYTDVPKLGYNSKTNTLQIMYNINFFFKQGMFPIKKKLTERIIKDTIENEKYSTDPIWLNYIEEYSAVVNYRKKLLNGLARFIGRYYVDNEYAQKEFNTDIASDKFYIDKIVEYVNTYNLIISMNTEIGMKQIELIIAVYEYDHKRQDINGYKLRDPNYIWNKTLYYLRKHIFAEDYYTFEIRGGEEKGKTNRGNMTYIANIEDEPIYAFIVLNQQILLQSGVDT